MARRSPAALARGAHTGVVVAVLLLVAVVEGVDALEVVCGGGDVRRLSVGCTRVSGTLVVANLTSSSLPSPITSVVAIDGDLRVEFNDGLQSLDGFERVASVGGSVVVRGNGALTSLAGLASIASVGGAVTITDNPSVVSLDGLLGRVAGVLTGPVTIANNTALASAVSVIGNASSITHNITVAHNPSLAALSGFRRVVYVGGGVRLLNMPSLAAVDGFGALAVVDGDVEFANLPSLSALPPFPSLQVLSFNGSLLISETGVVELNAFMDVVVELGDVDVNSNPLLVRVDGLRFLRTLGNTVRIANNPALRTIAGVMNGYRDDFGSAIPRRLATGQGVAIIACSNLATIDAFAGLSSATVVILTALESLSRVSPFTSLKRLSFGLLLSILGRDAASELDLGGVFPALEFLDQLLVADVFARVLSFPKLSVVTGAIGILGSPTLVEIAPFPALWTLRQIYVFNNTALRRIGGFPNLTEIESSINVWGNGNAQSPLEDVSLSFPRLKKCSGISILDNWGPYELSGFPALTQNTGDLRITNNVLLERVGGFASLVECGAVSITDSPSLVAIEGFPVVRRAASFYFGRLVNLTAIAAFPVVKTVEGSLFLDGLPQLVNVSAFNGPDVGGNLQVFGCHMLESLPWLDGTIVRTSFLFSTNLALAELPAINVGGESLVNRLLISDMPHLASLTPLRSANLYSLADVQIFNMNNLTSLAGLETVRHIANKLSMANCRILTDLSALDGLERVYGDLAIATTGLWHLNAFRGLVEVTGNIDISDNSDLVSLQGFDALRNVSGSVSIRYNPSLNVIDGIAALASIGGSLEINDNAALNAVVGFASLHSVGSFSLVRCPCTVASGFASLEYVNRTLEVTRTMLRSLSSFASVVSAGEVIVRENGRLVAAELTGLVTVEGALTLDHNPSIVEVGDGHFARLETAGSLTMSSLLSLRRLSGFGALRHVRGDVVALNNPALSKITGFNSLARVDGAVVIRGNMILDGLTMTILSLGSLEVADNSNAEYLNLIVVDNIAGHVIVEGNLALKRVRLSARTLGGTLTFRYNDVYLSNDPDNGDLSWQFGEVHGVTVTGNRQLTSLTLSGIGTLSGSLEITDNKSLEALFLPAILKDITNVVIDANAALWSISYEIPYITTLSRLGTSPDNLASKFLGAPFDVSNVFRVVGDTLRRADIAQWPRQVGSDWHLNAPNLVEPVVAPNLTSIGGDLFVTAPLDTVAFPALVTVSGSFYMFNCNVAGSSGWSDFPLLRSVGSSLAIIDSNVESIAGFNSLVTVGGFLAITDNVRLVGVDGMQQLRTIGTAGQSFDLYHSTYAAAIADNPVLQRVGGFRSVTAVYGPILVKGNEMLCAREVDLTLVAPPGSRVVDNADSSTCVCQGRTVHSDVDVWELRNCASVVGSLSVGPNVTTVAPMAALKTVSGDLVFDGVGVVDGGAPRFPALANVGGDVVVTSTHIASLSLPQLSVVNGSVVVQGNVSSVSAPLLASVLGDVVLGGALTTLGFDALSIIKGSLYLSGLTALSSAGNDQFPSLTWVGGHVVVANCAALVSFGAMRALVHVGGNFTVANNTALTTVQVAENVQTLVGTLTLSNCGSLARIDALVPSALSIGGLTMEDLPQLSAIHRLLVSLQHVAGSVLLDRVGQRTPIPVALPNLAEVTGDVTLVQSAISSLAGFASLARIGGSFSVVACNLVNVTGPRVGVGVVDAAPSAELWGVGGDLVFSNNSVLEGLAFPHLGFVGGVMEISGNPSLTRTAFPSLSVVNTSLRIENNARMATLAGWSGLSRIGDAIEPSGWDPSASSTSSPSPGAVTVALVIFNNPLLTSIDALGSVVYIGGHVAISNNTALCPRTIDLAATVVGGFSVSISNNSPGPCVCRQKVARARQAGLSYQGCAIVDGDLIVSQWLLDGEGYPANLTTITGSLTLTGLTGSSKNWLAVFAALRVIGGDLNVIENGFDAGVSSVPEANVTSVRVGGGLKVANNTRLLALDGFRISGTLRFASLTLNTVLSTFPALQGVTTIGPPPATTGGQYAQPAIEIIGNPALSSLQGFRRVSNVTGSVDIRNNPTLCFAKTVGWQIVVSDYLPANVVVQSNAVDCASCSSACAAIAGCWGALSTDCVACPIAKYGALCMPSVGDESEGSTNNSAAIAGGVVGGVVLLAILCGCIVLFIRREQVRLAVEKEYVARVDRLVAIFGVDRRDGSALSAASKQMGDLLTMVDDLSAWQLARTDLDIEEELGRGEFGVVHRAILTRDGTRTLVAVKTADNNLSVEEKMAFLSEASTMARLKHPHLVALIGVCAREDPFLLVMSYMAHGDLRSFLRRSRDANMVIPIVRLVSFCRQIASAMEYLAGERVVHRDLAARNVLCADGGIVKVADFGMSRDVYAQEYYRKVGATRLPIRWLAPECLEDRLFSSSSDCWAFGIVVWEIFSFGRTPYPALTNAQVMVEVMGGLRLSRPEDCPVEIYETVAPCWHKDAKKRPSFAVLHAAFVHLQEDAAGGKMAEVTRRHGSVAYLETGDAVIASGAGTDEPTTNEDIMESVPPLPGRYEELATPSRRATAPAVAAPRVSKGLGVLRSSLPSISPLRGGRSNARPNGLAATASDASDRGAIELRYVRTTLDGEEGTRAPKSDPLSETGYATVGDSFV